MVGPLIGKREFQVLQYPRGPRTQIMGFQDPNITMRMVFGTYRPNIWVLGPLGVGSRVKVLSHETSIS